MVAIVTLLLNLMIFIGNIPQYYILLYTGRKFLQYNDVTVPLSQSDLSVMAGDSLPTGEPGISKDTVRLYCLIVQLVLKGHCK